MHLDSPPLQRHLLLQVAGVTRELGTPADDAVRPSGDVAASLGRFLALKEGNGLALLAAQAAAMHEIAMLSLTRASANWASCDDHHRNVWDAVRACAMFMRQLDAVAKQVAALRRAEKAEAEELPAETPEPVDTARLAEDVLNEIDAREAALATQEDAPEAEDEDAEESATAHETRLKETPPMMKGFSNAFEEIDFVYNALRPKQRRASG